MHAPSAAVSPLRDTHDTSALWAGLATSAGIEPLCQSWLSLQCRTLNARAGVVLWRQPDTAFAPVAVWPALTQDVTYLGGAARQALTERRGLFVRETPGAVLPGRVYLAYPVGTEQNARAVAVMDLLVENDEQLQRAMQALHWGAGWLLSRVHGEELAETQAALDRAREANDTVALVGEQGEASAAMVGLVNHLAQRVQAQRVLVGVARDGRVQLRAISSAASFDPRTQAVAAIENLMEEALDQGSTVSAPLPAGGGFRVSVAHEEHRQAESLSSVASFLLSGRDGPIGVLTVEHGASSAGIDARQAQLLEAVALLVGPLLEDKIDLHRWFAGRSAATLRDGWARLTERGHGTFKLGAASLLILLALLAIARQDFRVSARAVVEGVVQRAAVAPYKGYVASAPVRAGQTVRQGDVLAVLDDRDLLLEQARWTAERDEAAQKYRDALAKKDRPGAVIVAAQMRQAQAQLDLVEEKLSRSRIAAPIAGVVVSGDLSQKLGSPVEAGEVLFEVAPLDAYRVVIQVDDRDIAYVETGQSGRIVLAGRPGDPLPFTVRNVTSVSEQRDGRNVFRVEAQLVDAVPDLRPGMEGVGKIVAGREPVLWVWTRRFTGWLRLTLWRWLP